MQTRTPAAATIGAPYTIHRYPTRLIQQALLADGRVALLRPVLPQDAELQQAFVRSLTPLSRRRRFHGPLNELPDSVVRYMTEVDYQSHLALLAEASEDATARSPRRAGFAAAMSLMPRFRNCSGRRLAARWSGCAPDEAADEERGGGRYRTACGDILADNLPMRAWLRRAGWLLRGDPFETRVLNVMFDLRAGKGLPLRRAA